MSELTPCNYCHYRRLKHSAKKEQKRIITKPSGMGGVDCFEVDKSGEEKCVAWFMELPSQCCC